MADQILQSGDSGEAVVQLQELLIARVEAAIAADGEFGEDTELAVKAFQEQNGLEADGIVGADTWAALQPEAVSEEVAEEVTEEATEEAAGEVA